MSKIKHDIMLLLCGAALFAITAFMLFGCSVIKKFNYSTKPSYDILYYEDRDESDVTVNVYIDNFGEAAIERLAFKCYFLDSNDNVLDTQEKIFNIKIEDKYAGNFSFVFESVKGKPSSIKFVNTGTLFETTSKENFLNWISAYWWIVVVAVVYLCFAILIGFLCAVYFDFDFDPTEPEFWTTFACGIFWPIGGIVLLIAYLKNRSSKTTDLNKNIDENDDFDYWTVEELKSYCRENGIKGYSKLTKNEIIALIKGTCSETENENSESSKKKKSLKDNQKAWGAESIPKIKFSDIAGLEEAKQTIQERVFCL